MPEKTRVDNDQEDELNQARFFAERGTRVANVEQPDKEEGQWTEEDIGETKSRGREAPGSVKDESRAADRSRFYGQGFQTSGKDDGIPREAREDSGFESVSGKGPEKQG